MALTRAPATVRRPPRSVLGTIALAGLAMFAAAVLILHVLRADLDPLGHTISEHALGDQGWLMTIAWFANGAAVLALVAGLRASLSPGTRVRTSTWLLATAGLCLVASGVFVIDLPDAEGMTGATLAGQVHDLAGLVGYLAFLLAVLVLQGVFARDQRWRALARPTNWFARALLGLFVARVGVVLAGLPGSAGLVQRLLWLVLLCWLALLAWHLRRIEDPPPTTVVQEPGATP